MAVLIEKLSGMIFKKLCDIERSSGRRIVIAAAESCTGGLLGAAITSVPGISRFFAGCIVAYDDSVKERILGVSHGTLQSYGAVAVETARAMARGAAETLCADLAVATTGIAGPGGGSTEKPVGTVCFGVYAGGRASGGKKIFRGGRERIRQQAVEEALKLILRSIGTIENAPGHRPEK